MKITCHHDAIVADIYIGAQSVSRITTELECLRQQSGQDRDVLTSTRWFVPETARSGELPLVMLLRKWRQPYGAVLLHGSKMVGVPSGVFKAGYSCGRGGVVGAAARQHEIVEDATRLLLKTNIAHTVVVSLMRCGQHGISSNVGTSEAGDGPWRLREMGTRLSLEGGMEGVLSRFSYKMRRNFRYYKKMAEKDFGCVFLPELSAEQSQDAVRQMHGKGLRPHKTDRAMRHEAALRGAPGGYAIGLTDKSGNWISYLAGWRQERTTYIQWQLNLDDVETSSISMAMRHYWIAHEIRLGASDIVFLGGTSPSWTRSCQPQIVGDLLATRKGLLGYALRQASTRLKPSGRIAELYAKEGTSFFADPQFPSGTLQDGPQRPSPPRSGYPGRAAITTAA